MMHHRFTPDCWAITRRRFAEANLAARVREARSPRARYVGVHADVERRRGEETLAIDVFPGTRLVVLDRDARTRHLLLLVQTAIDRFRLLFGHDERHLFIAPVPDAPATRVADAVRALQPPEVASALRAGLKVIRQGEWFLVPAPHFVAPKEALVEPRAALDAWFGARFRRGQPHVADEVLRVPAVDGIRPIFARGKVRHPDHATIDLASWHRVFRNAEPLDGPARWAVGYLD